VRAAERTYASRISLCAGVEEEKCLLCWRSREDEEEQEEFSTRAVGYSLEVIMVVCSCVVNQNREEKRAGEEEEAPACEGHLGRTCGDSAEVLPVPTELLHTIPVLQG